MGVLGGHFGAPRHRYSRRKQAQLIRLSPAFPGLLIPDVETVLSTRPIPPFLTTELKEHFRLLKDDVVVAEALRKVLASRRKVLGNDHPDTHNSLFSLADCLKTLDRLDEALPLYREELIGSKKLLGESHPDTKVSLKTMDEVLALTLKRAKHAAHGHEHLEEAERLFKSVISCQRPALGDTHPDTIASVGQLSHVLKKQHKLIEALSYYREVAAYHRAAFGDTHPDTLHHIFELAELLKHQHHVSGHAHGDGNDLEAEQLYREVLKGRQAVLGYNDALTMETIKHLAILLRHMPGRHAEAERLMIEAEGY